MVSAVTFLARQADMIQAEMEAELVALFGAGFSGC
jgi:hypothetical protein